MKVISFRPYKRWKDTKLINKIFETYEIIRQNQENNEDSIALCNILILEAKARGLTCPKELMYRNIFLK